MTCIENSSFWLLCEQQSEVFWLSPTLIPGISSVQLPTLWGPRAVLLSNQRFGGPSSWRGPLLCKSRAPQCPVSCPPAKEAEAEWSPGLALARCFVLLWPGAGSCGSPGRSAKTGSFRGARKMPVQEGWENADRGGIEVALCNAIPTPFGPPLGDPRLQSRLPTANSGSRGRSLGRKATTTISATLGVATRTQDSRPCRHLASRGQSRSQH